MRNKKLKKMIRSIEMEILTKEEKIKSKKTNVLLKQYLKQYLQEVM